MKSYKVWPFNWKLLSSTSAFLWCCLLCCTRWFQLWVWGWNPVVYPTVSPWYFWDKRWSNLHFGIFRGQMMYASCWLQQMKLGKKFKTKNKTRLYSPPMLLPQARNVRPRMASLKPNTIPNVWKPMGKFLFKPMHFSPRTATVRGTVSLV